MQEPDRRSRLERIVAVAAGFLSPQDQDRVADSIEVQLAVRCANGTIVASGQSDESRTELGRICRAVLPNRSQSNIRRIDRQEIVPKT